MEDPGSTPGSGRYPREGNGNPLQLTGESHGQRSLVGYSPQGRKESDTTEQLFNLLYLHISEDAEIRVGKATKIKFITIF